MRQLTPRDWIFYAVISIGIVLVFDWISEPSKTYRITTHVGNDAVVYENATDVIQLFDGVRFKVDGQWKSIRGQYWMELQGEE